MIMFTGNKQVINYLFKFTTKFLRYAIYWIVTYAYYLKMLVSIH